MTSALEMIDLDRTYTVKEFMTLPDNGKRYELIGGKLSEMPGPSIQHGLIIRNLFHYLDTYLTDHPTGKVLNNLAFELNPKNAPLPDLAFVLSERLQSIDYSDAFPGPPDIAIEVLSRTDYTFKTDDKIVEYLKAGTRLIWLINPNSNLVFVYHPGGAKPLILDGNDELEGEDVIPGFNVKVSALFE